MLPSNISKALRAMAFVVVGCTAGSGMVAQEDGGGSATETSALRARRGHGGSGGVGSPGGTGGTGSPAGGRGGVGVGGAVGAGGSPGAAGAAAGGGAGGSGGVADLCTGLIQDKSPHPMTTVAKPALGQVATDAEFGTKMRRITSVSGSGSAAAIVPMYSTSSAWTADESKMILLNIAAGRHELYDGKTYQFIRSLAEINPADVEQVYWHTSDPDVFFYVDGKTFVRYHVAAAKIENVTTFSFCSGNASNGSDPLFTSWDSGKLGLHCGDQVFIYDIASNTVLGRKTINENPAQVSPSGSFGYLSDSGRVTDTNLNVRRTLDLKEPWGHASLSRLATGEDTWNGQVFDNGPSGNSDIGSLVTFKLADGTSKVIIGPKTGYPYPPDGHISGMAYRRPGWIFVSTFGNHAGANLLDMENIVADTNTGRVCRAGRHRSWGKDNNVLGYWAEPHTVPSPSGTRAAFASDWGNGSSVDTYVLELPTYKP
jgi:hypothetical protein